MMALDWRGRYHSKKSAVNLFQPGFSLSKLRVVPPFRRVFFTRATDIAENKGLFVVHSVY